MYTGLEHLPLKWPTSFADLCLCFRYTAAAKAMISTTTVTASSKTNQNCEGGTIGYELGPTTLYERVTAEEYGPCPAWVNATTLAVYSAPCVRFFRNMDVTEAFTDTVVITDLFLSRICTYKQHNMQLVACLQKNWNSIAMTYTYSINLNLLVLTN